MDDLSILDERLKLMLTCCHPALASEKRSLDKLFYLSQLLIACQKFEMLFLRRVLTRPLFCDMPACMTGDPNEYVL